MQLPDPQVLAWAFKLWDTRRTQALLSMLGVVAGVCGLVIVIAVGAGAERELQRALGSLGAGSVIVRAPQGSHLSPRDVDVSMELLGSVIDIYSGALRRGPVIAAGDTEVAQVGLIGTDARYMELYSLRLHGGRFIAPHDLQARTPACVVGWELGRELFPRGQVIGKDLRYGNRRCHVVGWLARNSLPLPQLDGVADADRLLYLPVTTLAGRVTDYPLDEVTLRFEDESVLGAGLPVLQRIIEYRIGEGAELLVPVELLRQKQRLQQMLQYLLMGIAFVLLLVGGTGIMNTMMLNVISRRPEIGLRRALGATRADIIAQFVAESLVVALAGGLAGVLLGFLLSFLIDSFSEWNLVYHNAAALVGFAVSVLIGVVFGSYPALQAAAVSPVKSLNEI
ncbi:MAG: ABC transporter permease [Pseudomonadota bacterium]